MPSVTLKEIVKAQIAYQDTVFVPYTLDFEKPAQIKLDAFYNTTSWKNEVRNCMYFLSDGFDSWDTMIAPDPTVPGKQSDVYGNDWTVTDDIMHLDKPGMEGVGYADYKWPTLDAFLNFVNFEKLKKECAEHSDQFIIGRAGAGPFELSWRLMGVENALEASIADEDVYDDIIEHFTVLIEQFIDQCAKLPIDGIIFGDDWCDQRSCTMGPARWRRFIKPRLARLYDRIHKAGKITITHSCGSVRELIPDLIEIGLDILESVQPEASDMNPYELKQLYGKDIVFWGGLGCQHIVTFGTPDELRCEIKKLRREMSVGGGYILSPSKTLNKTIPLENLIAIYETFIEENKKL